MTLNSCTPVVIGMMGEVIWLIPASLPHGVNCLAPISGFAGLAAANAIPETDVLCFDIDVFKRGARTGVTDNALTVESISTVT